MSKRSVYEARVIEHFVGDQSGEFEDIQQLEEFVMSCGVDVREAYERALQSARHE